MKHGKALNAFPRSKQYNKNLIKEKSVGGNVLYATEALCNLINLKPGMRVLDIGCGKALSSVFLAKEYNVKVWAIDNYFTPTDNSKLINKFKQEDNVYPLFEDARRLPFPDNYFDAIVAVNSYTYFGTDDKYLPYVSRFLKPGGSICITDIAFAAEIETMASAPQFLKKDFFGYWYHIHSIKWWQNKWEKTGLVKVTHCDYLEEDTRIKKEYISYFRQSNSDAFAEALARDKENFIRFFALIGQRTGKEAFLEEKFT